MKLKCSHCKLQRSVELIDDGSGRLLYCNNGFDEKNRLLYTVYCRSCRHLSYYRLAVFGSRKIRPPIDARALYARVLDGLIGKEAMTSIGAHIQQAMIEDRVLPSRWELE